MTQKDFEKLRELLGDIKEKIAALSELFPSGVPLSPEVKFSFLLSCKVEGKSYSAIECYTDKPILESSP
jgi:hypothetical protein